MADSDGRLGRPTRTADSDGRLGRPTRTAGTRSYPTLMSDFGPDTCTTHARAQEAGDDTQHHGLRPWAAGHAHRREMHRLLTHSSSPTEACAVLYSHARSRGCPSKGSCTAQQGLPIPGVLYCAAEAAHPRGPVLRSRGCPSQGSCTAQQGLPIQGHPLHVSHRQLESAFENAATKKTRGISVLVNCHWVSEFKFQLLQVAVIRVNCLQ